MIYVIGARKMDIRTLPIYKLLQEHHINLPFVRVMESGDLLRLEDIVGSFSRPLLIADEASLAAATPYLENKLVDLISLIFPSPATASMGGCVATALQKTTDIAPDLIVVIGSGSLSDIGKYVAAKCDLPLTIIATAPSMNGYASVNASISQGGLKQSFPAKLAERIFICEDIINHAPEQMVQAGKADACASISADIDWKLSSLLCGTPYYTEVFDSQLAYLDTLDDRMQLTELLVIQGLAMTAAASSAPASGGEHMLAHAVELLEPDACKGLLHGQLIGITHPVYMRYQLELLQSPTPPKLRGLATKTQMQQCFAECWQILEPYYQKKVNMLNERKLTIEAKLEDKWPAIQASLEQHINQLEKLVSCSTYNSSVELTKHIEEILPFTAFTRDRFTMLDLELS